MDENNPLVVNAPWENVFQGESKAALEGMLPDYMRARRWFGGKARTIRRTVVTEVIPVETPSTNAYITNIRVEYQEGNPQTTSCP